MGWKFYDEAIDMAQRRFQYFPQVFYWRGRRYNVDGVEKCWSRSRGGWWPIARHYFLLRCGGGMFEVYQEVQGNTWHLRRAKPARFRVRAARQVAAAWR